MSEVIDQPFWDGLADGRLRLPCCTGCGKWTWPPQERCGPCGNWNMIWEDVPMEGFVHSYTWIHHAFTADTAGRTPFANLLVELPQAGGARLLGVLEGPADGLIIGASVCGKIMPGTDGQPVLRWKIAT